MPLMDWMHMHGSCLSLTWDEEVKCGGRWSMAMKDLRDYLTLPYTVTIRRDEDGDYVVRIDELPGCAAHGSTPHEAFEALEEAKELWITDCLESGDPVPTPSQAPEPGPLRYPNGA